MSGFPNENTIRRYLLGQLDDQERLENELGQQMFLNDELSEIADLIEDEIIEDYLDGTLGASDKRAVEEYFLRPSERKEKLRVAHLLRHHFRPQGHTSTESGRRRPHETAPKVTGEVTGGFEWRSHFRTYGELALLVLLAVSSFTYLASLRSQLEASHKNQADLERQLAQERAHSANLTKQLQEGLLPAATLSFFDTLRGNGETQRVAIRPFTVRINVEIALAGSSAKTYDVRLETEAGEQIWSQTGLSPSSGALRFEMPTRGITTGFYHLLVSSQPGRNAREYRFRTEIIQ